MTTNENIAWKRLSVEAAAIVGSILLAFSIDAWWEDRQDREFEQIALSGLLNDFQASRQELTRRLQTLESARNIFRDFLATSPEDLERISQSAAQQIANQINAGATFDPYMGTLNAITADGRLALVQNRNIRELLSRWTKSIDDSSEDAIYTRSSGNRVERAMEPHGGPFYSNYLGRSGPPASEIFPRATPSIVADLRRDFSFVSIARTHQAAISYYLIALRNSEMILDDVIRVLEQNVR